MSDKPVAGTWPDPDRLRLIRYATDPSSLESVAGAVSVASHGHRNLYIERGDAGWRWSLTSRGGPYPLIRITAQFLRCEDYWRLVVPFRTLDNGLCVLGLRDQDARDVSWAVLELDGPVSPSEAAKRILEALDGTRN